MKINKMLFVVLFIFIKNIYANEKVVHENQIDYDILAEKVAEKILKKLDYKKITIEMMKAKFEIERENKEYREKLLSELKREVSVYETRNKFEIIDLLNSGDFTSTEINKVNSESSISSLDIGVCLDNYLKYKQQKEKKLIARNISFNDWLDLLSL